MSDYIIKQLQKIDFIKSVTEITDEHLAITINYLKENEKLEDEFKKILINDVKINSKKIKVYKIIYKVGKIDVVGYIAFSNKLNLKKKNPVVVFMRGGSRDFASIKPSYFYSNRGDIFFLINKGYVLITTQYRGVAGGTGLDEMGGKDIKDCLKLFDLVKKLRFCDNNKLALYGVSRGGQMVLQLLKEKIKIKTAIVVVAPTNHIRDIKDNFRPDWKAHCERMFGGSIAGLKRRSAIYWADKIQNVPIYMFYGKNDVRVNVQDGIDLHKMLPQSKIVIYDDNHFISKNHLDMKKKILVWMKKHLH